MNPRALLAGIVLFTSASFGAEPDLKIGIIGLDSSHCVRFARLFNDATDKEHLPGARIVWAYRGGSPDVDLSRSRVEGFTAEMRDKYGVTLLDSIADLSTRSDAILMLSLDGRVHLAEARIVFQTGKPVFIDKPLAGSYADSVAIARLARELNVPLFSSSPRRFAPGIAKLRAAKIGALRGVISYGPAPIEPHVPDLFYYGVHATETLFTVIGPGCETVANTHTPDTDVVTGTWSGGRTGVVYALRNGRQGYGVTAFGTTGIVDDREERDYLGLTRQILQFFRTRQAPFPIQETLEIMAFMEAAEESKRQGGAPVDLKAFMARHGGPL